MTNRNSVCGLFVACCILVVTCQDSLETTFSTKSPTTNDVLNTDNSDFVPAPTAVLSTNSGENSGETFPPDNSIPPVIQTNSSAARTTTPPSSLEDDEGLFTPPQIAKETVRKQEESRDGNEDHLLQQRAHRVKPPVIDRWCMECICQASSGCSAAGCAKGQCGPYQISWDYWAAAGKIGAEFPGDNDAFQWCALNKTCAEQTVANTMSRFPRDCNADRQIECIDYARIHFAGPRECSGKWIDQTPYWEKFLECHRNVESVQPPKFPFNGETTAPTVEETFVPPISNGNRPVIVRPRPPPHPTNRPRPLPQEQRPQRPPPATNRPQPVVQPTSFVTAPLSRPTQRPSVGPENEGHLIIHRACLDCMCQAMNGCNSNKCGPDICGPYQISRPYWIDAGRPGDIRGNPLAWQVCALDKRCAETTIQRYMEKYARDCNNDRHIDCWDFARIHKAGPQACAGDWLNKHLFWRKFVQCTSAWVPPTANIVPHGHRGSTQQFISNIASETQRPFVQFSPDESRKQAKHNIETTSLLNNLSSNEKDSRSDDLDSNASLSQEENVSSETTAPIPTRQSSNETTNTNDQPSVENLQSSEITPLVSEREETLLDETIEAASLEDISTESSLLRTENNQNDESVESLNLNPGPIKFPQQGPILTKSPREEPEADSNLDIPGVMSPELAVIESIRQGQVLAALEESSHSAERSKFQAIETTIQSNIPLTQEGPAERDCLDCICQASSNCALVGCNLGICGPYQISREYWFDAGQIGVSEQVSTRKAFEVCAANKTCSEATVQGYLKNNLRDCDNNNVIDCLDFARIHKAGGSNCHLPWVDQSPFWRSFSQCYKQQEQSSLTITEPIKSPR